MIDSYRIAEVLGGRTVLGRRVKSALELHDAVAGGLPKVALRHVAQHVSADARERRAILYQIVPERNLGRTLV